MENCSSALSLRGWSSYGNAVSDITIANVYRKSRLQTFCGIVFEKTLFDISIFAKTRKIQTLIHLNLYPFQIISELSEGEFIFIYKCESEAKKIFFQLLIENSGILD